VIRAVIFDLGKVIVPFDLARGYRALRPHCRCAQEEIPKRIAATDLVYRIETGRMEPGEFVRELCSILELDVTYRQFCELWGSIFLPCPLIGEHLIEGLGRRYRLLILSNTNAIHFEIIRRRYPLLRHFHDFVLSYEVGAVKPEAAIYLEAVQRAGCLPEECFFTDDMPQFVAGAKALGLDAVEFRSAEALEQELRARGIEWD
jgi:FMN phosphatase YigB (HAD superfamily)